MLKNLLELPTISQWGLSNSPNYYEMSGIVAQKAIDIRYKINNQKLVRKTMIANANIDLRTALTEGYLITCVVSNQQLTLVGYNNDSSEFIAYYEGVFFQAPFREIEKGASNLYLLKE